MFVFSVVTLLSYTFVKHLHIVRTENPYELPFFGRGDLLPFGLVFQCSGLFYICSLKIS